MVEVVRDRYTRHYLEYSRRRAQCDDETPSILCRGYTIYNPLLLLLKVLTPSFRGVSTRSDLNKSDTQCLILCTLIESPRWSLKKFLYIILLYLFIVYVTSIISTYKIVQSYILLIKMTPNIIVFQKLLLTRVGCKSKRFLFSSVPSSVR